MKSELGKMVNLIIILIGLSASILGLYQWWNSKSELSFHYKTVRLNDFIESNPYSSGVKFNINGKTYNTIFISHIKIENTGNSDIRKDDYDGKPIKFLLSKNLSIIQTKDIVHSDLFNPEIKFSGDTIMIQPILFKKEFIVEFDLISQQPITTVKSLSLIAGLDLISANGFYKKRKKNHKTLVLVDDIIFYVSLGFYSFLFYVVIGGRRQNYKMIKVNELLNYRPTKQPYAVILFVTLIMAPLSISRVFFDTAEKELVWLFGSIGLGMMIGSILKFNPKGTLQPFEEIDEVISDEHQSLLENENNQTGGGQ
jgi:hypothetical protein